MIKGKRPKIPVAMEMRIVAYLARGDKHIDIVDHIEAEFGERLAKNTISVVKTRNESALKIIKDSIIKDEIATAQKLRDKTNKIIDRRLDTAEKDLQTLESLEHQFRKGHINYKEYSDALSKIKIPTLTELTSVSKEMHNQAQDEASKEGDGAKDNKDIWDVLRKGDDIELQRIVFGVKEEESKNVTSENSDDKLLPDNEAGGEGGD